MDNVPKAGDRVVIRLYDGTECEAIVMSVVQTLETPRLRVARASLSYTVELSQGLRVVR